MKAINKFKAKQARALAKANGTLADSQTQLTTLLPFKPIANDKDHDKKFIITHFMRLFPHEAELMDCFQLFRKNFGANLSDFDDEVMVLDFILPHLLRHFKAFKPQGFVRKNLALLQECFGLSKLECDVLYALFMLNKANKMIEDELGYFEICELLGEVLGLKQNKLAKLLMADMPLRSFGFIDVGGYRDNTLKLKDFATRIMQEPLIKQEMIKCLAKIHPKSTLERADFSYMQKDLDMLLGFCKKAKNPSIFLYGAPGVGKNEIAALIAKELNKQLWEIHDLEQGRRFKFEYDRVEQFICAQSMFQKECAIILLDECEAIFPSLNHRLFYENKPNKNTLNKMLESVQMPSIFLSNSADIDPAFLRRFDIVLEINPMPQEKKRELVDKSLKSQKISLDSEIIAQIASSQLTQGVIIKACKVANALAKNSPNSLQSSLLKVLNEHLRLQNASEISTHKASVPPYSMGLIHASMDMEQLSCNIESALKDAKSFQGVRILAHGMPGSGKSEYAKALAKRLNKPIIFKRASDLLSKWVGENEQNIAAAFKEADSQKAILVLDEADSFLQDRGGASHSWEVSKTNEMLTQMESFSGIFIATTNFLESLDSASLRRFDFKVEFKALDFTRLCEAFRIYGEFLGLNDVEGFLSSSEGKTGLRRLENVSLGDFALLVRGARFDKIKSANELFCRLKDEAGIKESHKGAKCVGF